MNHEKKLVRYGKLQLKDSEILGDHKRFHSKGKHKDKKLWWVCNCGRSIQVSAAMVVEGLITACGICTVEDSGTFTFICTKCNLPRSSKEYQWTITNGQFYRDVNCKSCKSVSRKKYHNTHGEHAKETHTALRKRRLAEGGDKALEWWFARHISQWRAKSKRVGLPEVDLDVSYLITLFHRQNGLCHYSGIGLSINNFGRKHVGLSGPLDGAMSLDRKTPKLGYVKDNVVLCTYWVNTMKGHRTHDEFVAICETIYHRMKDADRPRQRVLISGG
jgi:hypothetical protein